MEPAGIEELDMLPIKRKSPQHGSSARSGDYCLLPDVGAAGAAPPPLPLRAHQRVSHGPTCSSPAVGGWGMRNCSSDTSSCNGEEDSGHMGDSARGKAQRVCTNAAATTGGRGAAASGGEALHAQAAAKRQEQLMGQVPSCCPHGGGSSGSSGGCALLPGLGSLPHSLYHSFHAGCCSRLSSASLTELDTADVVAAGAGSGSAEAQAATAADDSCQPGAAQASPGGGGFGILPRHSCPQQQLLLHCFPQLTQAAHDEHQQRGQAGEIEASYWADMPDDILKRVLERLQPSTLRVLRLVCRGWESAASRLLTHLRPETVAGKRLGHRFPALHSLDLSNCMMGVDFATPRMLRLQSLLADDHLAELAGLTRLEQLSLRGCNRLSGSGLAQLACLPALAMLNLSNCAGITDVGLAALAASAPQLGTLNLQGCCRVGDGGVAHLVALPALRHVLLPAGVSDASMQLLTEMPALERVALRGCARVTTAGIYMLLQRRGLKRVVISKCPQVTLESLCEESNLKVVTEPGSQSAPRVLSGAAYAAAAGAAAGMVGHDMQLLVAEV